MPAEDTTKSPQGASATVRPVKRSILLLLRVAGPLTGHEIADELGLPYLSVANRCSEMARSGELAESPNIEGSWRGRYYRANAEMTCNDMSALISLLDSYGVDTILSIVGEVEP